MAERVNGIQRMKEGNFNAQMNESSEEENSICARIMAERRKERTKSKKGGVEKESLGRVNELMRKEKSKTGRQERRTQSWHIYACAALPGDDR